MPNIAIIHPEGNFNNNPNLSGIISIFVEQGHDVQLYCAKREEVNQLSANDRIKVHLFTPQIKFQHDAAVVLPSIMDVDPLISAANLASHIKKPDLIIGVDRGIIEAAAFAKIWKIPLGLISYEIYFAGETSTAFKEPEIVACTDLSFAVCQDNLRAEALCNENKIEKEKVIYIPVAGRGKRPRIKNSLIHNALGLDSNMHLALYMGEISCGWSCIDEIILNAKQWPADWSLILHHRYGASSATEIFGKVINTQRKNIYFSPFQPLSLDDMSQLLGAIDVGFAFYKSVPGNPTSGDNLGKIGMASGKIGTYLQHGVPVLVNELGEMSDYVREFNIGGVAQKVDHIPELLCSIANNIGGYADRSHKFFMDKLDLNKTINPLLAKLESMFSR